MAAKDRAVSLAQTEVSCWNVDRRWGFRGTKGYGISRNYYHRAQRRFGKSLCVAPDAPDILRPIPELYVHGISDPKQW